MSVNIFYIYLARHAGFFIFNTLNPRYQGLFSFLSENQIALQNGVCKYSIERWDCQKLYTPATDYGSKAS